MRGIDLREIDVNIWQSVLRKRIQAVKNHEKLEYRGLDVTAEMQRVAEITWEMMKKSEEAFDILDDIEARANTFVISDGERVMNEWQRFQENRKRLEQRRNSYPMLAKQTRTP